MMRRSSIELFLLVLVLVLAPAGRSSAQADLGEPFTLAPGESLAVGAHSLVVGFHGILGDCRCPTGVVCFWEGDAIASLWALTPTLPAPELFELHTCSNPNVHFCHRTADILEHHFALQDVSPYPVWDAPPIPPEDYRVTLVVTAVDVAVEPRTWGAVKGLYR